MKRTPIILALALLLSFAAAQADTWNVSALASIVASDIDASLAPCEVELEGSVCIKDRGSPDAVASRIARAMDEYGDVSTMSPWVIEEGGFHTRPYLIQDDSLEHYHAFLFIVSESLNDRHYAYINIASLGIYDSAGNEVP